MRRLHRISLPCILLVFSGFFLVQKINAKCIYLKPIEIKKLDVGNMISWSTYKEVDNKYFVIEKSVDGINFQRTGDVKGAGYSNSVNSYRFLDFSLGENKTFYRILHYQFDGSYTMSNTFVIERNKKNNLMLTSMSSPVTDKKISLTVKSVIGSSLSFELKKINGEVIARGKKKVVKGLNALSFDCSNLPNGRYEIVLKNNEEVEKINFRKVKSSEVPNVDYEVKQR